MCDSLSNTISKIEDGKLVGYVVCEACGEEVTACVQDYSPNPKLEMPTPPSQ